MSHMASAGDAPCDEDRARAAGKVTGHADLMLDDAVAQLRELGQPELAEHIIHQLVGRNVLPGRWSFQVVEDYDDGYYRCFQEIERLVRRRLTGGRRHAYETQLKERRRTPGHPAHTARPIDDPRQGVNR